MRERGLSNVQRRVYPSLSHFETDEEDEDEEEERSSIRAVRMRAEKGLGEGVKERDQRTRPPRVWMEMWSSLPRGGLAGLGWAGLDE